MFNSPSTNELSILQKIDDSILIPAAQITLIEMIGKGMIRNLPCLCAFRLLTACFLGQFGVVYRGVLTKNGIPQPVAIKTIKRMICK